MGLRVGGQHPLVWRRSWSLEVFKNHGDVALREVVSGPGGGGVGDGLGDLRGLFQP